MKINIRNAREIGAALDAAQGRRTAFTLNRHEVFFFGERAETALEDANIAKRNRSGAKAYLRVDGPGRAYKHTATVTVVELTRGKEAWFLTWIGSEKAYPGTSAGYERLTLTPAQELEAVEKFRDALSHI